MNKKAQFFEVAVFIFTGIALFTIFTALNFKYSFFESGGIGMYAGGLVNTYQNQEEILMGFDLIMSQSADQTILEAGEKGGLIIPDCENNIYHLWNNKDKECIPDYEKNITALLNTTLVENIKKHQSFLLGNNFNFQLQQNNKLSFMATAIKKLTITVEVSAALAKECQTPITGKNSISFDEAKDYIQSKYPNSPFAKNPDLIQVVIDESEKRNIDAVFPLAFFQHESWFGTSGIAARTKNPGNIRIRGSCAFDDPSKNICLQRGGRNCNIPRKCICAYADCNPTSGCFCGFSDWKAGIIAWFDLIETGYISQGFTSVETIIPKYAPRADNNDESRYIMSVKEFASQYKNVPCKVHLGEYTFRPTTNTKKDYNLSWYAALAKFSRTLIDNCADNTSNCVVQNIKDYNNKSKENITFYRSCEDGDKEVFYEFLEKLNDCTTTIDDNCRCKLNAINSTPSLQLINISKGASNNGLKYYNITFVATSSGEDNITRTFSTNEDLLMPISYMYLYNNKGIYKGRTITFIDSSGKETKFENFDSIYLVKNLTDEFIVVEDEGEFFDSNNVKKDVPTETCNTVRQNYNFCLQTDKDFRKVTETSMDYEDANIKFGLTLIDRIPPKLISVVAEDYTGRAKAIVLKWTLPKYSQTNEYPEDIVEYKIYCSKDEIKESKDLYALKATYTIIPTDKVQKDFKIGIENCGTIPIVDGHTYYFAVTPVDVAGQENMDAEIVTGVSMDDANPTPTNVDFGVAKIT